MTIQDLNLGFLYEEKKGVYIDKEHPFDEKWDNEYLKFSEYLKNTTIDKYFELMIYAHRDLYPRGYWTATILKSGYSPDFKKHKDQYTILDGSLFVYPELKKLKRVEKTDKDDFVYTYEYVYEFNQSISLNKTIEKALEGKEYTKTEEFSSTNYKLENSPIDSIKTGSDFLSFTINEDFYEYRMF